VVPKTYLPNYREFYEKRHFVSGANIVEHTIRIGGHEAPFGTDMLFRATGGVPITFHVEICEDIWVPVPPSSHAALAGAEAAGESLGQPTSPSARPRRGACYAAASRRAASPPTAYSASGPGESTDRPRLGRSRRRSMSWADQLAESTRFERDSTIVQADVDLGRIRQERPAQQRLRRLCPDRAGRRVALRKVAFSLDAPKDSVALRVDRALPLRAVRPGQAARQLLRGLQHPGPGAGAAPDVEPHRKAIIGVSGGLDSTQALIVTCRAMDQLKLPRKNIFAYTLPGFGTSDKTHKNAWRLMEALGVTAAEIDIKPAAQQMLADIGHPFAKGKKVYDVTFENVQAGLRTDYLFRLANQQGGMVVGTGDLSELGLGWCTYGVGDHMSHYNPNGSVSKTLIQHLIRFVAASGDVSKETAEILHDILDTEISPELIPAGATGAIQSTEQSVGPYALQDFNLFYLTRLGFRPSKIAFLAWNAWHDIDKGAWPANLPAGTRRAYELGEIRHWLKLFLRRFFTNQFKRSALPNGPKISSGGSLSPRGDWRAPSDGSPDIWLAEVETVPEKAK
jgi:NAD+ synthase (glutamine-hydrolysing)